MSPGAIAELHQFLLRMREMIGSSDQFDKMCIALSILIGAQPLYVMGNQHYIPIRGLVGYKPEEGQLDTIYATRFS